MPWRAVEGHPCQQEGGKVTSPFWAEATAGTLEKGLASSAVRPEFAGERGVAGAAEGHGARACKDLTWPESSDFLRGARTCVGHACVHTLSRCSQHLLRARAEEAVVTNAVKTLCATDRLYWGRGVRGQEMDENQNLNAQKSMLR